MNLGHEESAVRALDLWKADTDCFYTYKKQTPTNEAHPPNGLFFLTHLDDSWGATNPD